MWYLDYFDPSVIYESEGFNAKYDNFILLCLVACENFVGLIVTIPSW